MYYETDLFDDIIKEIQELSGKQYNDYQKEFRIIADHSRSCLLYTSDAADDLLSVDLGGRRIIKKKKISLAITTYRQTT